MNRWAKRGATTILAVVMIALAVVSFPQPSFAYSMSHGNFRVWSDRPISPAMTRVLDDAERRLRTSDLYDGEAKFRIFICNEAWRMRLYARNASIGGMADPLLTRHIFIREADIERNRVLPPPPHTQLADADVRPLAYFIAHEATHVMQSRAFGRLMGLRYPDWLVEGHADLVAKGGQFDLADNLALLRRGDPRLDYGKSGLYRRYHLMVAMLTKRTGRPIESLFADPPKEEEVVRWLLHSSSVADEATPSS